MLDTDRSSAALLIRTIEATGGIVRYADGTAAPVGDRDWIDLADAYIAACGELGREVLVAPAAEEDEPVEAQCSDLAETP